MSNDGLNLIIYGEMKKPVASGLNDFWTDFIELQKGLKSHGNVGNVFVHSCNPEYAALIDFVYQPSASLHEEINHYDLGSSSKKMSFFKDVMSRSKAINLAKGFLGSLDNSQTILISWNLSLKGNYATNRMVVDEGLPPDLIYLAYHSRVDTGYANHWIVAPFSVVKIFEDFELFCSEQKRFFTTRRSSLEKLKELVALSRITLNDRILLYFSILAKICLKMRKKSLNINAFSRVRYKIFETLEKKIFNKPINSNENSLFGTLQKNNKSEQSLLVEPQEHLFKRFIIGNGLRNRVRFLVPEDFENNTTYQPVLRGQPCILFAKVRQKPGKRMIRELILKSPIPIKSFFLYGKTKVYCFVLGKNGVLYEKKYISINDCKHNLTQIVVRIYQSYPIDLPYIVMRSPEHFLGCQDWPYFNALLKYFVFSSKNCVAFDSTKTSEISGDFPNVKYYNKKSSFSLESGLLSANGIKELSEAFSSRTSGNNSNGSITMSSDFLCVEKILFSETDET